MTTANAPNDLPSEGFARLPQVIHALGVSRATLWRGVRNGIFPKPIKLTERTTVWRVEDIRAFIASLAAPNDENNSTPKGKKGYGGE